MAERLMFWKAAVKTEFNPVLANTKLRNWEGSFASILTDIQTVNVELFPNKSRSEMKPRVYLITCVTERPV